jgi:hypothetical protein
MILGWLAAGILAVPMSAQALLVTVDGTAYDVTTKQGTFEDLDAVLINQVWWGNQSLAIKFAQELKTALGRVNTSEAPRRSARS